MKNYQSPVFVLILFLFVMVGNDTIAQQNMTVSKTKVAIRKFSGFSEFLSLGQFVECLNKLNSDGNIVYVKYSDGMRYDFVADVKSENSFPKEMVNRASSTMADQVNSNAIYAGNNSNAANNSGNANEVRTIGAYYDNDYSLYDDEGPEIGFGTVILSISQPGLNRRPAYKKAIYLEDAALLIEESLFDELLSNMFSYFRKVDMPDGVPY
jgi:hypothetical protein